MKHTPLHPFEIPVAVTEQYEIPFAQFELCENGILVTRLDDELCFDKETAVIFMNAVKKLGKGKSLKMLMLTGTQTSGDSDSRSYFALPEHKHYLSKSAVVISSFSQRMIGNFFHRVNKPAIESRLFNDPVEGWNWLIGEGGEKG